MKRVLIWRHSLSSYKNRTHLWWSLLVMRFNLQLLSRGKNPPSNRLTPHTNICWNVNWYWLTICAIYFCMSCIPSKPWESCIFSILKLVFSCLCSWFIERHTACNNIAHELHILQYVSSKSEVLIPKIDVVEKLNKGKLRNEKILSKTF